MKTKDLTDHHPVAATAVLKAMWPEIAHKLRKTGHTGRDFRVPPESVKLTSGYRYYQRRHPESWGKWYEQCKKLWDKQILAKAMANQPKPKRKASPKKCGFCGQAGHSRRNCEAMKSFIAKAHKANENWRRVAYNLLVKKLGLSVGAAIKVQQDYYGSENVEKIALVSSINWDKLNVTCANGRWGDYRQALEIQIIIDGQKKYLSFDGDQMRDDLNPTFMSVEGYSRWKYIQAVAAAPKPLDESWVTDYKDAFEYLAKKRTLERLKEESIVTLVEAWSKVGQ